MFTQICVLDEADKMMEQGMAECAAGPLTSPPDCARACRGVFVVLQPTHIGKAIFYNIICFVALLYAISLSIP